MTDIPATELSDPTLYINRELSWLEFNRRCLLESLRPDLPLLERLRFLTIFSNNLDEFFMVRVSGLKDQVSAGIADSVPDGLSSQKQLELIRERVLPMVQQQRSALHDDILPKLGEHGVHILSVDQLEAHDREVLRRFFENEMFPILTPLAVDPGRPFPHISNLSLNLAVAIKDKHGRERFARVKVPPIFSRTLSLTQIYQQYDGAARSDHAHTYIWLEDLISAHLDMLFPGMTVTSASAFRVTRNNDIEIAEEEASDLLESVEDIVRQRRFGPVVRLEVVDDMPEPIRTLLMENLEVAPDDIYVMPAPLGVKDISDLCNLDIPALRFPPYMPQRPPELPQGVDIFAAIRQGDILLHHPYDSFQPTVEFFQQAAEDPNVLAIKTTLYRVGSKSP
ncbi:partial polyphosphate kinase, partial [Anaerolineae bacterium]